MKQGKCLTCKIYFHWDKDVPARELCCPRCAPTILTTLKRTTDDLGTGYKPKFQRVRLDQPPLSRLYLREVKP